MKRLLVLFFWGCNYLRVVASEEQLLRNYAIFHTVHVPADNVDYDATYFKEEFFTDYVGMPVLKEIALGHRGTPAMRRLVGFLCKDGKKYTCKSLPDIQKNEKLVIDAEFFGYEYSNPTVCIKREIKNRWVACCWGRISCLEIIHPELEKQL